MRLEARSTANHSQTLRWRRPTKGHSSATSRATGFRRWAFFVRRRGNRGKTSAAYFITLAMVIRVTPVARTMLRWELRSVSKVTTWAYCAALVTVAGTNHSLYPHTLHWYFGWLPCVPLRRMCSLPQRAHKGYV